MCIVVTFTAWYLRKNTVLFNFLCQWAKKNKSQENPPRRKDTKKKKRSGTTTLFKTKLLKQEVMKGGTDVFSYSTAVEERSMEKQKIQPMV